MKRTRIPAFSVFFITVICCLYSCTNNSRTEHDTATIAVNEQTRIVSLSGTVTEILYDLGLEQNLVATDITSTYPESVQALPKVGHNRNMSAENILAQTPSIVIGLKEFIKPELAEQLKGAGVTLLSYDFEYSVDGGKKLIRQLADTFGLSAKADPLIEGIDRDLAGAAPSAVHPRVLFIYARGAGTLMAAGEETAPNTMIRLAGGENAVTGFTDFKPLTPEALVQANPDVILMFRDGLMSLGGMEGLMQVQGIAQTNAGKNRQVIEMDALLLSGFGPRVGKAITELSQKMNEVVVNR